MSPEPYEPSWRDHANCSGVDGDLFFPSPGTGVPWKAKQICAACIMRDDCLTYALENNIKAGIWGGKTGSERNKMRLRSIS